MVRGFRVFTFIVAALFYSGCEILTSSDDEFSREFLVPIEDMLDGAVVVEKNPHGIAPLTAAVSFRTQQATTLSYKVLGADTLAVDSEILTEEHSINVLGLYADSSNKIVLTLRVPGETYAVDTLTIETAPLPEFFPEVNIVAANRERMENGWTLSGSSIGNAGRYESYPFVFDTNGEVRWYLDLSEIGFALPVERLRNGNLMVPMGNDLREVSWTGEVLNTWVIEDWQHHDIVEKPDGNFIVAVDRPGIGSVEDHIVEIDRESGALVREWDLRQILDVDRTSLINDTFDWFHMNSVWYVEDEDALIVSGRNQGVVKLSGQNELIWIMAPHTGWGKAGLDGNGHETSDFLLTAVDAGGVPYPESVQLGNESASSFDWPWTQHAAMTLANNRILLFDNGANRHFGSGRLYSRAVEYEVDDAAMEVQQVWEYGSVRGLDYYSVIISDVDYLEETGNILVMPGFVNSPVPRAFVTEVDRSTGLVVFEATIDFKNLYGNGQGWGQADLVYRSERVSLLPD